MLVLCMHIYCTFPQHAICIFMQTQQHTLTLNTHLYCILYWRLNKIQITSNRSRNTSGHVHNLQDIMVFNSQNQSFGKLRHYGLYIEGGQQYSVVLGVHVYFGLEVVWNIINISKGKCKHHSSLLCSSEANVILDALMHYYINQRHATPTHMNTWTHDSTFPCVK